jgi:predicted small integral membrane protein
MWRAINSTAVYHAFYAGIILWEAAATALIGFGAWKLWVARGTNAATFNRAKGLAVFGLTVNLLQWFVAFLTVGGEWFLMWQSRTWNGQDAAFRMFACAGIVLLFLSRDDSELADK